MESTTNTSSSLEVSKKRRAQLPQAECCRTCRLRKVKCTGNPGNGPCTNCTRLSLTCSFTDASGNSDFNEKVLRSAPSQSHTEAGTLRKRAQRACSLCHSHKTKCSGDLPKCKRCAAGGLNCEYVPAKRKFSNLPHQSRSPPEKPQTHEVVRQSSESTEHSLSSAFSSVNGRGFGPSGTFLLLADVSVLTAEERLMRKDLVLKHFDAYMENLYSIPVMGFLHPTTTYRQIHEGSLQPARAAAICCAASFFVNPGKAARDFGAKCNDEVEMHLFRNAYKFEEDILLLSAMNMVFNFLNMSFSKVWACMGLATRILLGLQANWEGNVGGISFLEQECHRRVAWQIWFFDLLLAGGYDEYISCRRELMKIRLPCNETAFRENRQVHAERLSDTPGKSRDALGLAGWQIRLTDTRHRIQVMTRKLMPGANTNWSQLEPSRIMREINNFQNELNRIHASLPENIRLSDQSIARYLPSQERAGYVYLHGHLSVCHTDLYRFALPNLLEQTYAEGLQQLPKEFVANCQKQTVGHALCLARYYEYIQDKIGTTPKDGLVPLVADCTVGHMATNAIRILLVGLQYSLFEDLDKVTTAPLWRFEPPTKADVWRMIGACLKITEPWCDILPIVKEAHDFNKAMVEEFDRTRKFTDVRNSFIIKTNPSAIKNEEAIPLSQVSVAPGPGPSPGFVDRWLNMSTPINTASSSNLSLHEPCNTDDYAPPGMPVFLGHIRGVPSKPWNPAESQYPASHEWFDTSNNKLPPWAESETSQLATMPDYTAQMMPMDTQPDTMMYQTMGSQEQPQGLPPNQHHPQPQHSHHHPHPHHPQNSQQPNQMQSMPQQQPDSFVGGYLGQYPLENAESSSGYIV